MHSTSKCGRDRRDHLPINSQHWLLSCNSQLEGDGQVQQVRVWHLPLEPCQRLRGRLLYIVFEGYQDEAQTRLTPTQAWKERFGRPTEEKGGASVGLDGISVSYEKKIEYVNNSSNALRNCLCGHHYNYHS